MVDALDNAGTGIVADPASITTPVAAASDDASPELKAYAESQAQEMDALARMIEGMMNEPGIDDTKRGDLAALKGSVVGAAANLRSGSISLISVGGMSAAAAQAYAAAKGIDKASDEQQSEGASSGANIEISASAAAAANDNFIRFSNAHAMRLQQQMANGNEQGAVALDVMKSQASQIAWDNREAAAAGYAKDSPEYLQYMMQTETFALLTARGEQRENIYKELAARQGLTEHTPEYKRFMEEHRAMDRTQDDESYKRHYETARDKLLSKYPGAAEELEKLEKNPNNEGKAFLLALKEDPNAARELVAKYGHELSQKELADLSPEDRAKYLTAQVTLSMHESLYVEGEQLKDTFLNFEKQRLSIDESNLPLDQKLVLKEQAFDRTIEETQRILGRKLSPEELGIMLEKTKEHDNGLSTTTGNVILGSHEPVQDAETKIERKAAVEPAIDGKLAQVLAETEEHKKRMGLIEYSPENKHCLASSNDIFAGILAKCNFQGTSLVTAANDHVDHGQLNELAQNVPITQGYELTKAAAAVEHGAVRMHKS